MQKSNQSFLLQKLFGLKLTGLLGRKGIFLCLLTCLLLYYLLPYFFRYFMQSYRSKEELCLKRHLSKLSSVSANFDAVISKLQHNQADSVQIPFVGNGNVGVIADYEHSNLYLLNENIGVDQKFATEKFVRLPFSLLIIPQYGLLRREEAEVLNYRHGIVEHLTCFVTPEHSSGVVFVNHTVVAHRSRPDLFLQHLEARIEGKSFALSNVGLIQDLPTTALGFRTFPSNKNIKLYGGVLEFGHAYIAVAVAANSIPALLQIDDNKAHIDSIAVLKHGQPHQDKSHARVELAKLVQKAGSEASHVLEIPIDNLLAEHKNAWSDILHTGLTISHSTVLEPGIPHPISINSTLYSVLSSMDSKLHDEGLPQEERRDLIKRLQTPDFCYNHNPTLHAEQFWRQPASITDVIDLADLWTRTLEKSGCKHLVSEGAEGMLQAMVLSFGRLQFTEFYLQVWADSDILHNDISFRGVMYKNDTVDIAIQYEEGQSSIQISLKGPTRHPLYACEASCLNIVEVSKQPSTIPVYIIYPPSPILYISHQRKHLEGLKDSIIIKKKVDHAQHMELKKEAGLPLIFWLSIGSLIVLFHLYLIRLICKEYYSSATLPSHMPRTYYSNRGRLAS